VLQRQQQQPALPAAGAFDRHSEAVDRWQLLPCAPPHRLRAAAHLLTTTTPANHRQAPGKMNKLLQNVNVAGTSLFFQILAVGALLLC